MSSPPRDDREAPFPIVGRRTRSDTIDSVDSNVVDWVELSKTEATETRNEISDESTAFLLARLEHENQALVKDPKSNFAARRRKGRHSRPPSIHVLKQLVDNPSGIEMALATPAEPPAMSELEFWAAVCKDFPQTIIRLPTLTANKIKAGIPPPLRGVVWVSMAGARDHYLAQEYERLVGETSPYDDIIGKDIGRSFPEVAMFRERGGAGQQMLGRVLKCFSLHDEEIGYCQGLGFLVGPLLMQMGEKDAFCVLVRLMENYGLRSCFLPTLSGLHLRIYQFKQLLTQHIPDIAAHFARLGVEPAYLSQWFLSFFAVTCPLPMLMRAYDIIFAEGAPETTMRVALAIIKRNAERILGHNDFDDVVQLLLSKAVWEPYRRNGDDFVDDFMGLTGLVTRESLERLETEFMETRVEDLASKSGFLPASAAASRFLGRLWSTNNPNKRATSSPTKSHDASVITRSQSRQSFASEVNPIEIQLDPLDISNTVIAEPLPLNGQSTPDDISMTDVNSVTYSVLQTATTSKVDKDLHGQIEGLLTALSELQRERTILVSQLQKEREERADDQRSMREAAQHLRSNAAAENRKARRRTAQYPLPSGTGLEEGLADILEKLDKRLALECASRGSSRRSSLLESKQRLRESLGRSKDQLTIEISRSQTLTQRLDEQENETNTLREQLRDAQSRLQEGMKDRHKLEKTIQESRSRQNSNHEKSFMWRTESPQEPRSSRPSSPNGSGLRELKLSRGSTTIPRRMSSLTTVQTTTPLNRDDMSTEGELLAELVKSKTSEALARQELEETKAQLENIRRTMSLAGPQPIIGIPALPPTQDQPRSLLVQRATSPMPLLPASGNVGRLALPTSLSGAGGLWGWGKRSFSGVVSPEKM